MNGYKIKNIIFFLFFIVTNPSLVYLFLTKKIYIPVYVQFQWLKKYKIKTIIDVGAHNGRVSQVLNEMFPNAKVYTFEPNKNLHTSIKNKINSKVLTLESFALSNKIGKQDIYFATDSTLTSVLPLLTPGAREGVNVKTTKQTVKTTTLDKYFKNKKVKKPIFLKIDVEGAEGLVLKGASNFLKEVAVIHVETYFKNIYQNQTLFEEVYKTLTSCNFMYLGIAQESYFYPNFTLPTITNSVFVNTKLIHFD